VPVLLALAAGSGPLELASQVVLHGLLYGAIGPGHAFNAVLLKEHDCPAAHAAGEHDVGPVAGDKARHLPRLVVAKVRIVHRLHLADLLVLHVHQDKVRATSKVRADYAIHTVVVVGRNCNSHCSLLPYSTLRSNCWIRSIVSASCCRSAFSVSPSCASS